MARKTNKSIKEKGTYYQVIEGEWVPVPWKGFKEQCCSCGLIHIVDYRVVDNVLQFRAKVDGRATGGARRPYQFTPEEE